MKRILTLAILAVGTSLAAQDRFEINQIVPPASTPPPSTGAVYFYPTATGGCSGSSCTGKVTMCLSSNSTSCGGAQVANTDIFYTLDGSPASEADIWYDPSKGPFTIPDPGSTRLVTINAVLVQTKNTGTVIQTGATTSGCSSGSPCWGVIVQNGLITKSALNMNVACYKTGGTGIPAAQVCPTTVFNQSTAAVTPSPQWGNCDTGSSPDDRGVRGVPQQVWYYVNLAQPTVDMFTNTSTTVEMDLATANAADCGFGTAGTGDTEFLVPAIRNSNQNPGSSSLLCDKCISFASSFYVAHNYQGTTGTTLNAANVSEDERDDNQENATYASATGFGYGTFNARCSMENATPYTGVSGKKYGQWEYSSQNGTHNSWDVFQGRYSGLAPVTHDCTHPFGTVTGAALANTNSCSSVNTIVFAPGKTNTLYNGGEDSYGVEHGFMFVDQGTTNAESMLVTLNSGNTITGCIRGVGGTTPHTHSSGALAVIAVKVQMHATQDVTTGGTCNVGTSNANAMYMDYISMNGNYYGTAEYQPLMGASLLSPSITVLDTWPSQTISGHARSKVCSYFGTSSSGSKFFDQVQPYGKPGTNNPIKIGFYDLHNNTTGGWGIVGSPSQLTLTQAP